MKNSIVVDIKHLWEILDMVKHSIDKHNCNDSLKVVRFEYTQEAQELKFVGLDGHCLFVTTLEVGRIEDNPAQDFTFHIYSDVVENLQQACKIKKGSLELIYDDVAHSLTWTLGHTVTFKTLSNYEYIIYERLIEKTDNYSEISKNGFAFNGKIMAQLSKVTKHWTAFRMFFSIEHNLESVLLKGKIHSREAIVIIMPLKLAPDFI